MFRYVLVIVLCSSFISQVSAKGPLKVFVLVGQSNMQGHAEVSTFEHIGKDPQTAPILKEMLGEDGTPTISDQVWITSIGNDQSGQEYHGQLTAGYGAKGRGVKIGPEFTFGIYMQKQLGEPILIIKTAWGGKSLHTDFRPPTSGAYKFSEAQVALLKKKGKDVDQEIATRTAASGHYYRLMMEHVRRVLKDIKRVYPDYDAVAGYELAGMVWFQGWNDMVDGGVYPNRDKPGGYDQYSNLMAQFIRDVRRDLSSPQLPFVIGVMGVGGPVAGYRPDQERHKAVHQNFRDAMAAPASLPEFKGNVLAVRTENYWDSELDALKTRSDKVRAKSRELNKDETLNRQEREAILTEFREGLYSPQERVILKGSSNAAYHYLGSAKIMSQIGKGFAEAFTKIDAAAN